MFSYYFGIAVGETELEMGQSPVACQSLQSTSSAFEAVPRSHGNRNIFNQSKSDSNVIMELAYMTLLSGNESCSYFSYKQVYPC